MLLMGVRPNGSAMPCAGLPAGPTLWRNQGKPKTVTDDPPSDDALEQDLKQLLVDIEKEPLPPEVRALAEKLQKRLNERRQAQQKCA
jgi:N-methylhydantoinase A/oxoprolinase/acetone carboxylase beta subunit